MDNGREKENAKKEEKEKTCDFFGSFRLQFSIFGRPELPRAQPLLAASFFFFLSFSFQACKYCRCIAVGSGLDISECGLCVGRTNQLPCVFLVEGAVGNSGP